MSSLNDRQRRFIEEYLIDMNGTQAAIRAGYSKKTANEQASRLLANVNIKSALAAAQQRVAKRVEVSQDWVLSNLKTVTERCMQVAPVLDRKGSPVLVENAEGDMVPAFVFNAMGANRSLELLGKHIGMFTEKVQLSGDSEKPVMLGGDVKLTLSPDETYRQMLNSTDA
jgi:phage terminase small subunit